MALVQDLDVGAALREGLGTVLPFRREAVFVDEHGLEAVFDLLLPGAGVDHGRGELQSLQIWQASVSELKQSFAEQVDRLHVTDQYLWLFIDVGRDLHDLPWNLVHLEAGNFLFSLLFLLGEQVRWDSRCVLQSRSHFVV